eukprot:2257959-Rhodomonas_salina.1
MHVGPLRNQRGEGGGDRGLPLPEGPFHPTSFKASDSEGSASALSLFQAIKVGCMKTRCESGCVRSRSAWSNVQSGRAAALPRGTMPTAARTLRGPCINSHTHLPACRPVCMQPSMAP